MLTDRRSFLAGTAGLALAGTLRADEPRTLAVLIFGGELPEVQKDLEKAYRVKVTEGGQAPPKDPAKKDAVLKTVRAEMPCFAHIRITA